LKIVVGSAEIFEIWIVFGHGSAAHSSLGATSATAVGFRTEFRFCAISSPARVGDWIGGKLG
jgi:hypothetical protein